MDITDISGKVKLSNGYEMPYLGLGVYKAKDGLEVEKSIRWAIDEGYRLIDTAKFYDNEEGVGAAIRASGIAREEFFVTTKLWIDDQSDKTEEAFEKSFSRLNLEYIDLFLIHWPVPGKYLESWKILQDLYKNKKVKAIGVSNCMIHHLESIRKIGGVQPMVLQNEFHPRLIQQDILDYCKDNKIQYQGWSPLMRGKILENEILQDIAIKKNKSSAQVVLRWALQKGVSVIPKSIHQERIKENAMLFDFELSENDMKRINGLENNYRTGAHPDNFMKHFQ